MARHRGTAGSLSSARSGARPKTFEEGRVCLHPTCSTKLSRYNSDLVCALHLGSHEVSRHRITG